MFEKGFANKSFLLFHSAPELFGATTKEMEQ
jgi:hypothetical protein